MDFTKEDYLKACGQGDLKQVERLFNELSRQKIESLKDSHDASCLHYAARNGRINVLDYLIRVKGVSPFLVSEVGATIMHDAAVKGRTETIEWIVKHTQLSFSLKDSNGATILHLAAKFDQVNLVKWILKRDNGQLAKIQTYNGATCLHFAVVTNSINSLKAILEIVPSLINIQMSNGVTPVYLAVQENNLPLVKYLTRMGANVNIRAEDGMNSVHVSCQNGNLDMVTFLHEEYGANLNEKDFNGATPLHYACINGNPNLVAYLLGNGAKILIDKFGNSPLHDCSVGGHLECARYLISSNCDATLKDNQNMTSADIAESYGHMEFAKEIRKIEKMILSRNINNTEQSSTKNDQLHIKKSQKLNESRVENTCVKYFVAEENDKQKKVSSTVLVDNVSNSNSGKNQLLAAHHHTQSVTSPMFNSIPVVNTSTPSSLIDESTDQEESHLANNQKPVKNSEKPKFSKQDFTVQVNKNEIKTELANLNKNIQASTFGNLSNQGFIKIIRNDDSDKNSKNKMTILPLNMHKVNDSTFVIEELDKCIAEFEDTDFNGRSNSNLVTSPNPLSTNSSYLSNINDDQSPKMSATIETIEFIGNRSHNISDNSFKSPDQNNNNKDDYQFNTKYMKKLYNNNNVANTLPNKLSKTSLTSSASQPPPPPPPPPMSANTWLSLNANSNASKNFLKSNNQQSNSTKSNNNRGSANFIDELHNQIKNGGVYPLKKTKLVDSSSSNSFKSGASSNGKITIDDLSRKKLKPFDTNSESSNTDEINNQPNLKQIANDRILKSNNLESEMPQWKKQLIEKKKLQQNAT